MKVFKIALALSALTLCSCASVVATTQGPPKNGNLVFAGTKLNSSIISKKSCADTSAENHGCAYDGVLAPLSILDFIPSLALDTILLPFTALHTVLQPTPSAVAKPEGSQLANTN